MNTNIRPAAVAGLFYPADPLELTTMLAGLFAQTKTTISVPHAIIAPHAGYIYSGPVAAQVYRQVQPAHAKFTRVILLGPCHFVPVAGVALSSAHFFATPLGNIPVDQPAQLQIMQLPGDIEISDEAHSEEHSLEVQLPFLQSTLDNFSIVPIVVGDASPELIKSIIELFADDMHTLIVVSSDLSHYHDYNSARNIDAATTHLIENLDYTHLRPQFACGAYPIRGLLAYAKDNDLHITTLMQNNSGDTAGDKNRVVGYGGYALL